MPGWAVALYPREISIAQLADLLRRCEPAVVGTVEANRLLLNLRSVLSEQDLRLVDALDQLGEDSSKKAD